MRTAVPEKILKIIADINTQGNASLKRLTATLDQRAPALANAAQGTLQQAGRASVSVGKAADRVTVSADRIGNAAGRAEELLTPGSPVLAGVQQAAEELGRTAAALRAATSEESPNVQGVQRAMSDVSRAARAVRELADTLEQQPQSLIRGKNP